MLESELGTHTLSACLENPPDAPTTVKSAKAIILKADLNALLSSSLNHPSAKYIADVATEISWCRLWDTSLDHGVQGTRRLQLLLKELSRRLYDGFSCRSCNSNLNDNPSWLHHICSHHPEAVDNLSCEEIISALNIIIINPRRACAARVTVVVLCVCVCVCLCVCVSVSTYSRATGTKPAHER